MRSGSLPRCARILSCLREDFLRGVVKLTRREGGQERSALQRFDKKSTIKHDDEEDGEDWRQFDQTTILPNKRRREGDTGTAAIILDIEDKDDRALLHTIIIVADSKDAHGRMMLDPMFLEFLSRFFKGQKINIYRTRKQRRISI